MARKKITHVLQPGISLDALDVRVAFRALIVRNMGQNLPPAMLPIALRASLGCGMGWMMVRPSVTGGASLIADRKVAGIAPQSPHRPESPVMAGAAILIELSMGDRDRIGLINTAAAGQPGPGDKAERDDQS